MDVSNIFILSMILPRARQNVLNPTKIKLTIVTLHEVSASNTAQTESGAQHHHFFMVKKNSDSEFRDTCG